MERNERIDQALGQWQVPGVTPTKEAKPPLKDEGKPGGGGWTANLPDLRRQTAEEGTQKKDKEGGGWFDFGGGGGSPPTDAKVKLMKVSNRIKLKPTD